MRLLYGNLDLQGVSPSAILRLHSVVIVHPVTFVDSICLDQGQLLACHQSCMPLHTGAGPEVL